MELIRMEKEHCEILAELEKLCFPHPWSQKSLELSLIHISEPTRH